MLKEYIEDKQLAFEDYLFSIKPFMANRYLKNLGKRVDRYVDKYGDLWKFIKWIVFFIFLIAVIITFLNLAFRLGILLGYF